MNRKSSSSKRAVEELFSNNTDTVRAENSVSNVIDRRAELKKQFFQNSSAAYFTDEKSYDVSAAVKAENKSGDLSVTVECGTKHFSEEAEGTTFNKGIKKVDVSSSHISSPTVQVPKRVSCVTSEHKTERHAAHTYEYNGSVNRRAKKDNTDNNKKNKKNGKMLVIVTSVFGLLAVSVSAILFIFVSGRNSAVPADSICGIGVSMSYEKSVSENSDRGFYNDNRHKVTFTFYDSPEIICTTSETTVGDLIDKLDIEVDEMKRMSHSREDTVTEDVTVDIKTLSYVSAEETEAIPFETTYIDIQTIPRGSTSVYISGADGVKTYTYKCLLVNGVEESRELTNEKVTTSPTTQVLYRGVGGTVTSQGKTYSYSYYIDVSATTYHIVGTTAYGLPTSESVMAVDPSVIRLGTACVVKGSYGDFGYRIAADTGGNIKGNKIDIWLPQNSYYSGGFGWRSMRVYILD